MSQEVRYGKRILEFLSSVRFAVILLTIIAISCILGTLIKQRASPQEYLELYSETTYKIIFLLGLDDLFHTWWFISLLFLFTVNLFFCSLKRLKKDFSFPDQEIPLLETFKSSKDSLYVQGKTLESAVESLKNDYRLVQWTAEGALLEKGRLSKFGIHLVHGSIILILLGSLIGLLFGFRGFIVLREGEEIDYVTKRGRNSENIKLDFSLKCRDFRIEYYPDGSTPKEYITELEIIKNGTKVLESQIEVNRPLKYAGIYFYQSSYGKEGIFYFDVDGNERVLKEFEILREGDLIMRVVRYESSIHNFGPGILVGYLEGDRPQTVWFLRDVQRMKTKRIAGRTVTLKDIKEDIYTVLEVSKDPGIYVVWSGFSFLIFGLFLNFFVTPKRIYLRKDTEGLWVLVRSRRTKESAIKEIERIKGKFHVE
ncbi:MAG: cytochrome c biogenesis protein ResB [Desulfobacterota bacterium]|nr:cytochrome c biogenesis protein ResB [Thermodesulfobacteriota bacterium]MDW8001760.1 cytochrome c biogenesis protein ResB [Deltaproteobacteria bacterium]